LSKQLVTIRADLPLTLDLDRLQLERPDRARLRELFLDLEFHTLVRDFAPDEEEQAAGERMPTDYRLLDTAEAVHEVVRRIRAQGFFAVDPETSSTDPMRAELCGISLSLQPGEGFYLPFRHRLPAPAQGDLLGGGGDPSPEARKQAGPKNLPDLHSPEMRELI